LKIWSIGRAYVSRVRSELMVAALAKTGPDKDGFGVLGAALGSAMVNQLIDSFISPVALIRASDNPNFAERVKTLDVRRGYFLGPTTFRLDIEGPPINIEGPPINENSKEKVGLIFGFQGTGWRVIHVDFPWNELNEIQEAQGSAASSSPASAVTTNKAKIVPECKVEHWKYSGLGNSHLKIEGTTSCASGTIRIQAFDGKGTYLGNGFDIIQSNSFDTYIGSPAPEKLEIKYQISAD